MLSLAYFLNAYEIHTVNTMKVYIAHLVLLLLPILASTVSSLTLLLLSCGFLMIPVTDYSESHLFLKLSSKS